MNVWPWILQNNQPSNYSLQLLTTSQQFLSFFIWVSLYAPLLHPHRGAMASITVFPESRHATVQMVSMLSNTKFLGAPEPVTEMMRFGSIWISFDTSIASVWWFLHCPSRSEIVQMIIDCHISKATFTHLVQHLKPLKPCWITVSTKAICVGVGLFLSFVPLRHISQKKYSKSTSFLHVGLPSSASSIWMVRSKKRRWAKEDFCHSSCAVRAFSTIFTTSRVKRGQVKRNEKKTDRL